MCINLLVAENISTHFCSFFFTINKTFSSLTSYIKIWCELYCHHKDRVHFTTPHKLHCAGRFVDMFFSPELLASGKVEVSLRLYCSVRLATLYRLPLVEKLSPSAWPGPNTATSHGELSSVPQELLAVSTVVESGRGNCTVVWGKRTQVYNQIHIKVINIKALGNDYTVLFTVRTVLLEVLYVTEKDAESSALMQVEFPSFTSRVTAWMQPLEENREANSDD